MRGRLDWKYCLGLELEDEGFGFSVLSEFRSRLAAGGMETALLEALLARLGGLGLVSGGCGSGPIPRMCWAGSGT